MSNHHTVEILRTNKWHTTVMGRTVCAWPDFRPWPSDQSWEDHCRRKQHSFSSDALPSGQADFTEAIVVNE